MGPRKAAVLALKDAHKTGLLDEADKPTDIGEEAWDEATGSLDLSELKVHDEELEPILQRCGERLQSLDGACTC